LPKEHFVVKTLIRSALASVTLLLAAPLQAQDWPDIFDPLVLRTLNLQMSNEDWQTIQGDETLDIEVPTLLWLDGEQPILVSIRRKSADPLTTAPGYDKVSYKIDINELVSGQNWHGLRAVSLDNGDDQDVVSEGLAWYLHRRASGPEGYGYNAGLASWVRLVINGVDTGVYVNAEQRDKRFLENRGLWVEDETWLYEVEDLQGFELDEGEGDSPTFTTLCYSPFASPSSCATPDTATLAAQVPNWVDMQGLLTLAAVDSFSGNPDAIFSHGKNFYFADFLSGAPRRLHFPWDLDSAMGGGAVNEDIYATGSAYSQILLAVPQFRAQYSQILNDLVCGPFQESQLNAFIDALEPVLSAALEADPNNQLGGQSVAEFFDNRRSWITQRLVSVRSQIEGFVPCGCTGAVSSYCTAKVNSAGCTPSIGSTGTPSASAGSGFVVNAEQVLSGKAGLLLYSTHGPGGAPFQGGFLCATPPTRRTPLQISGASGAPPCTGTYSLDFNARIASGVDPALVSGQQVWSQYWTRDSGVPSGTGLTNGLSFTICQ
jgi:hypothetical protein